MCRRSPTHALLVGARPCACPLARRRRLTACGGAATWGCPYPERRQHVCPADMWGKMRVLAKEIDGRFRGTGPGPSEAEGTSRLQQNAQTGPLVGGVPACARPHADRSTPREEKHLFLTGLLSTENHEKPHSAEALAPPARGAAVARAIQGQAGVEMAGRRRVGAWVAPLLLISPPNGRPGALF
jgi:hypothetical protein